MTYKCDVTVWRAPLHKFCRDCSVEIGSTHVLNHYSFPFYQYKKSRFLEVFKVFELICTRYLVIFTVLKLSFVFLKVSNWSVTFLSSAHVLFILASISPTCPPLRRMWVQVAFYTKPKNFPKSQKPNKPNITQTKQVKYNWDQTQHPNTAQMHKRCSWKTVTDQCPTGRVFQYQVGYWKEYWVANRVWVR